MDGGTNFKKALLRPFAAVCAILTHQTTTLLRPYTPQFTPTRLSLSKLDPVPVAFHATQQIRLSRSNFLLNSVLPHEVMSSDN